MKKRLALMLLVLFVFLSLRHAKAEEKKEENLKVANISKAILIVQKNRELFKDPEMLKKFLSVAKSMKLKK